ncbi:phage tail tube protein [Glutamicibacter arilaitensis]|uniref:phage tail tube protein n=1 Tax=Glutamicibacter arilaitensis TaxID=256701 RepID=UPI003F938883
MVNAQNVLVGAPDQKTTGAILSAVLETELPTSPLETPDPAFQSSGYISESGLTATPERSTSSIKDWSGAIIRQLLEEFNGTLAWEHLETNKQSLATYFGDDNVTVASATAETGEQMTAVLGAFELPRKSWLFRIKDGKKRVLIKVPDGQVTEQGEVSFIKTGAILWPVTLTTYPDSEGNNIYIITDDGEFAA